MVTIVMILIIIIGLCKANDKISFTNLYDFFFFKATLTLLLVFSKKEHTVSNISVASCLSDDTWLQAYGLYFKC